MPEANGETDGDGDSESDVLCVDERVSHCEAESDRHGAGERDPDIDSVAVMLASVRDGALEKDADSEPELDALARAVAEADAEAVAGPVGVGERVARAVRVGDGRACTTVIPSAGDARTFAAVATDHRRVPDKALRTTTAPASVCTNRLFCASSTGAALMAPPSSSSGAEEEPCCGRGHTIAGGS